MKVFITGGSGFVGGAAVKKLIKHHEIFAMSRSDTSDKVIETLGAKPVRCALNDIKQAEFDGIDYVIHCAAFVEQWGPYETFYDFNVKGTQDLLTKANAAGVKRFIHIGTEASIFYGQHMRNVDETEPLAIDSPFPYSRTKALAEKAVVEFDGPMETISIRPRMIWGENDQTILPIVIQMHKEGKFMWVNHGKNLTSTTNIKNLIHALELALTQGKNRNAYFVTDGKSVPFKQFLSAYAQTQNVDLGDKSIPTWLMLALGAVVETIWKTFNLKSEPLMTRFTANIMCRDSIINDAKAHKELGYTPLVNLEQGLAELTA